jgi:hypothetical protein
MISNEKSMKYKALALNEIYNCRITFVVDPSLYK